MSESDSAKQAAVTWIHEQMEHHGLTFEDLVEAGCFADIDVADLEHRAEHEGGEEAQAETDGKPAAPAAPAAPARAATLYRNAMGQTWDGTGEYPDWLQRAVNAGQSIDFYRVD